MANTSVARTGQESTTRIERGGRLFEEHGDEIRFDSTEKLWLVPSQRVETSVYEVTLGRRGEFCECKDWEYRSPAGGCAHIVAATLKRAKSFRCEGCGERFPNRERVEVMSDEHPTCFEGQALCRQCTRRHGVL